MPSDSIAYFGKTNFRREDKTFGIKLPDRRQHVYIIGKSGTGKSTLIKNLIIQDIRSGRGVGLLDPHGDLVEDILNYIPSSRTGEVVYFNPADQEFPIGFNILESIEDGFKPLVASSLISVFKNIWNDSWGPRLEYILYNAVAALLDYESTTLLAIPRLLENKKFRALVIEKIQDPLVKNFWVQEYEKYSSEFRKEAISPIQNKVGQFLTSAPIRNILSQVKSKIEMGFIMDNRRIFLCNLAKGKMGEDKTNLLGSLIMTKMFLAGLKRVERREDSRKDFFLYIDECQSFATSILGSMLSEARKYRINLTLTHQYLGQLSEEVKKSIIGNVGTLISFRLGSHDASELEKEFSPQFSIENLENLGKYQIYLKLLIDGLPSRPFSAQTLPPATPNKNEGNKENIIKSSRQKYGTRRELIEDRINRWLNS